MQSPQVHGKRSVQRIRRGVESLRRGPQGGRIDGGLRTGFHTDYDAGARAAVPCDGVSALGADRSSHPIRDLAGGVLVSGLHHHPDDLLGA